MSRHRINIRALHALCCAALVALGASCGNSTGVLADGGDAVLTRPAGAGRVAITNGTAFPVFTFVVGREAGVVVEWSPCVDSNICPPIAAGATATVTPATVPTDPASGPEAIVYWWHAVPDGSGGARPDSIRSQIVRL